MSAPHGSDTKVSLFAGLAEHFLVFAVIVALLARLSSFQMFTDNVNLIFIVLDNVRPMRVRSPVSDKFRGVRTSIKNFKGGHLQTSLIAIVVREFGKWKRFLPFLTEQNDTSLKHIFKHLIESFNLS